MRSGIVILLVLGFCSVFAQVQDDFSDGNLLQDPEWTGDTDLFKVSSSTAIPSWHRPGLQLDAVQAGTAWLSLDAGMDLSVLEGQETKWSFWLKQSYNSSSNNFSRIYLVSDSTDLSGPLEGYFIQTGGSDDSVRFFRQDGVAVVKLLTVCNLYAGESSNAFRFLVTRSETGCWKFFADPTGGEILVYCGEMCDQTYSGLYHFGIWTSYTSSNATKFYFDELNIQVSVPDQDPPVLFRATMLPSSQVLLEFSEPLARLAADTIHYTLDNGIGHPYEAILLTDPEKVHLFFDAVFVPEKIYILRIANIADLFGNISGIINVSVSYQPLKAYEVAITEIMPDPFPQVGLPGYEYIELLNRSSRPVDLSGCSLRINSQHHPLPDITIPAGAYLLLVSVEAVNFFSVFGPVIGLTSIGLSNEGAEIILSDEDGNTLACVNYDDGWYGDVMKKEGGWSLEMIDPWNPCEGDGNWMASEDPSGGTPGKQNSAEHENVLDKTIERICCPDPHVIELTFSGQMDSLSLTSPENYLLDHGLGHPVAADSDGPEHRSVNLSFGHALQDGIVYTVEASLLKDCTGRPIPNSFRAEAGLPGRCNPFDVLISEILFNPIGDGVDFVEIYNRSGKIVDLSALSLASVRDRFPAPSDTQKVSVSDNCRYLFPGAYLALTPNPKLLSEQYFCPDPRSLLMVRSFPAFNNEEGVVLLTTADGVTVDGMGYQETMHYPLLNTTEGVSLERISFNQPGTDSRNWISAAAWSGYATPGYENTQHVEINDQSPDDITIWPPVFSPDGDGKDDVLAISCRFVSAGFAGSVMIFDAEGRLVRTVAGNTLFGVENHFFWDGRTDGCIMAAPGFYVVRVEALDLQGDTFRFKKAVALFR